MNKRFISTVSSLYNKLYSTSRVMFNSEVHPYSEIVFFNINNKEATQDPSQPKNHTNTMGAFSFT